MVVDVLVGSVYFPASKYMACGESLMPFVVGSKKILKSSIVFINLKFWRSFRIFRKIKFFCTFRIYFGKIEVNLWKSRSHFCFILRSETKLEEIWQFYTTLRGKMRRKECTHRIYGKFLQIFICNRNGWEDDPEE